MNIFLLAYKRNHCLLRFKLSTMSDVIRKKESYEASKSVFFHYLIQSFLGNLEKLWMECYGEIYETAGDSNHVMNSMKKRLEVEESCISVIMETEESYSIFTSKLKEYFYSEETSVDISHLQFLKMCKRIAYEFLPMTDPKVRKNVAEHEYFHRKALLYQMLDIKLKALFNESLLPFLFSLPVPKDRKVKRNVKSKKISSQLSQSPLETENKTSPFSIGEDKEQENERERNAHSYTNLLSYTEQQDNNDWDERFLYQQ